MTKGSGKVNVDSIETWEDLRRVKQELRGEMDVLGESIASSAREVMVKGAKVTAATIASIVVAKGIAAYSRVRREKAAISNRSATAEGSIAPTSPQEDFDEEPATNSRLATLFMYVDVIVKLIRSAQMIYGNIHDLRSNTGAEEQE